MKAIFYAAYLVQLILSCPVGGGRYGLLEKRLNSAVSCGFIEDELIRFFGSFWAAHLD